MSKTAIDDSASSLERARTLLGELALYCNENGITILGCVCNPDVPEGTQNTWFAGCGEKDLAEMISENMPGVVAQLFKDGRG